MENNPSQNSGLTLTDQTARAVHRAQEHLLRRQHAPGFWMGKLESDASVTAGYIALMYFLFGWVEPNRLQKVIALVLDRQSADGSWPSYYDGPGDLDVSIQCYFGLKLGGLSAEHPAMERARRFIRSQGGISKARTFTKIWLAVFGQFDYRGAPSAPPEVIFLPNSFYFNIYEFASWSRETLMALTVVLTRKPVCQVPDGRGVEELYVEPPGIERRQLPSIGNPFSWRGFFLIADRLFKLWDSLPSPPGRAKALNRVQDWILEHQEKDGSWGGILLPWIYSLFALKSLGFSAEHPAIVRGIEGFEDFLFEEGNTLEFMAATSPVWDTAWAALALRESGLPAGHRALVQAARWLLQKEIRQKGDWKIKNPELEPGGWSFEFFNDWYPDLDDSSLAPRALLRIDLKGEDLQQRSAAVERALNWILQMQSKDGGWAAFDRDNDHAALNYVPFGDFLSPLDPTCADVTAHVLELLADLGTGKPAQDRAVEYLKKTQEPDGCWYGRWGVNYLYGTGLALGGLAAAGEDMRQQYVRRAVDWLWSHQNADGGWGESCQSYSDPTLRGKGASTTSQSAWVIQGLIAAGEVENPRLEAGIRFLIDRQNPDGSWDEPQFTGTGFPKVMYLRYDLYRVYFPLLALARYLKAVKRLTHI